MAKCLATDTGFALMGIDPDDGQDRAGPAAPGRRSSTATRTCATRARSSGDGQRLRQPGEEFTLIGDVAGRLAVPAGPIRQAPGRKAAGRQPRGGATNKFAAQPLRLRIEALMAAGPYDAPGQSDAGRFSVDRASSRTVHAPPGVRPNCDRRRSSARQGTRQRLLHGHQQPVPRRAAAWTMMEKRFTPPLNLSDHQALGVWVHGDGQGEVLNLQLRSPEHLVGDRRPLHADRLHRLAILRADRARGRRSPTILALRRHLRHLSRVGQLGQMRRSGCGTTTCRRASR